MPVEHIVVDLKAEGGEANVLVVANETVVGEPLLDRIRERAARGPASFLIICPQSDPTRAEHPEAERRLRRALAVLRGEGIEAHGQVAHPDPYTAAMQAVHDERVDEIIVSTFAPERSPWLQEEPRPAAAQDTKLPVEHVVVAEEGAVTVTAHAESASRAAGRAPELAGRRRDARDAAVHRVGDHALRLVLHELLLRPRRRTPPASGRRAGFHLPVFVAGVNTAILLTSSFTMHWALQAIKRGNRAGLQAGLVLTFCWARRSC